MKPIALLAGILPLLMTASQPANAAAHELSAGYCSGGDVGIIDGDGFIEPPGVNDMSKESFAAPVANSGVVEFPLIGDSPAAKWPEGTNIFNLGDPVHPSADNCANSPLP